jgi:hypothetical protein
LIGAIIVSASAIDAPNDRKWAALVAGQKKQFGGIKRKN